MKSLDFNIHTGETPVNPTPYGGNSRKPHLVRGKPP